MDPYLLKYIGDFLIQCELCKIMEIDVKKCCICKVSYCKKCEFVLKSMFEITKKIQ